MFADNRSRPRYQRDEAGHARPRARRVASILLLLAPLLVAGCSSVASLDESESYRGARADGLPLEPLRIESANLVDAPTDVLGNDVYRYGCTLMNALVCGCTDPIAPCECVCSFPRQ